MLFTLAKERNLKQQIDAMFAGEHINSTENRAVLHVALRSHLSDRFSDSGHDVVKDVHHVLNQIKQFTEEVRSGIIMGYTC